MQRRVEQTTNPLVKRDAQDIFEAAFLVHNLDEEDSVTSAGALVQFGGCCGAIKAGRDKVFVKIWEGGDGDVRKAGDQNVLILVLSDWQILGAWRKQIQHLREEVQNHWWHEHETRVNY